MKFVNMLLANNIRPILVFDGCHLPAKKETETKRREYVILGMEINWYTLRITLKFQPSLD